MRVALLSCSFRDARLAFLACNKARVSPAILNESLVDVQKRPRSRNLRSAGFWLRVASNRARAACISTIISSRVGISGKNSVVNPSRMPAASARQSLPGVVKTAIVAFTTTNNNGQWLARDTACQASQLVSAHIVN